MKMKALPYLFFGVCLLLTRISSAQPHSAKALYPHLPNPALQEYIEKNVNPVLQQQRQKLEIQLSTADKERLASLRTQFASLHQEGTSFRKPFPRKPGERPAPPTEEQRQLMQKHRETMRALMAEAGTLAKNYETQINSLMAEISGKAATWKTDMKALAAATPEGKHPNLNRGHHNRHGRKPFIAAPYRRPVEFLLMEVKPSSADLQTGISQIYPNPAITSQTISYQISAPDKVSIELLNANGQVLKSLMNDKKENGQFKLDVNIADLKDGTYFYRITTKSSTEVKRFIKK